MAAALRRRVIFMVGLYRGGNRYEMHFEPLADFTDLEAIPRAERDRRVERSGDALCRAPRALRARSAVELVQLPRFLEARRVTETSSRRASFVEHRARVAAVLTVLSLWRPLLLPRTGTSPRSSSARPGNLTRTRGSRSASTYRYSPSPSTRRASCCSRRPTAWRSARHRRRRKRSRSKATRVTLERERPEADARSAGESGRRGADREHPRARSRGTSRRSSREYSVQLEGDASRWRLVLRPLDASLASLVERIEIGGVEAQVQAVEIFQADGDRSVMNISPCQCADARARASPSASGSSGSRSVSGR